MARKSNKPKRLTRAEKRQGPRTVNEVKEYDSNFVAPKLLAKNGTQKLYLNALEDSACRLIFAMGPAGTGKTYMPSAYAALQYHKTKKQIDGINKIIITRPNVSMGRSNGFLPGTLEEKSKPWAIPIDEVLKKHLEKGEYETALKNEDILFVPVEFMRGRSFPNAMIIIDEAQNLTKHEFKGILTRIGENSTMVICGDPDQCDIDPRDSGLELMLDLADKHFDEETVDIIEFSEDDCVRDVIAKTWIKIFRKEKI